MISNIQGKKHSVFPPKKLGSIYRGGGLDPFYSIQGGIHQSIDNDQCILNCWNMSSQFFTICVEKYIQTILILSLHLICLMTKPTKWHVHPAKTQISLGICPVLSESSLSWRVWSVSMKKATHWATSKDWSDWVDAQADLSYRWVQSFYFCFFFMRQLSFMHLHSRED